MKKVSLTIAIATILLASCQKQFDVPSIPATKQAEVLAARESVITAKDMHTEIVDSRLFNECTGEYIHLTGEAHYNLHYTISDNHYHITYQINYAGVTGVGEISGTVYHGGGADVGTTNASFSKDNVEGFVGYHVGFHAPGGAMWSFKQNAHFVFGNGEIKVEFNNESESCKP